MSHRIRSAMGDHVDPICASCFDSWMWPTDVPTASGYQYCDVSGYFFLPFLGVNDELQMPFCVGITAL